MNQDNGASASRPSHRVMRSLAAASERIHVPNGYEANIVLVNRKDRDAHIFVGSSDPRDLKTAMEELIDNPDQVGIVNRDGVKLEI